MASAHFSPRRIFENTRIVIAEKGANRSAMKKRSKREARQQIKERWFDAGAAAFERVFPGARARRFPDIDNPYICPLCERPFPRSAIEDGTLTFEDAPPKSYGGKPVALSCKGCNNSLG